MEKAIVVIVSDNQLMGEEIVKNLSSLGYEMPYLVTDGNQAITKAEELKPDIVIIDADLQGSTDTIDTATHIQRGLRIPVIFIIDITGIEGNDSGYCRFHRSYLSCPGCDSLDAVVVFSKWSEGLVGKDTDPIHRIRFYESRCLTHSLPCTYRI